MTVDNHLPRIIRDLGHALVKALAASPSVGDVVREIRHQGYSLYLVFDRKKEGDSGTQIELTADPSPAEKPVFRLNKGDVCFLESVGIDATRPGKRRRA